MIDGQKWAGLQMFQQLPASISIVVASYILNLEGSLSNGCSLMCSLAGWILSHMRMQYRKLRVECREKRERV